MVLDRRLGILWKILLITPGSFEFLWKHILVSIAIFGLLTSVRLLPRLWLITLIIFMLFVFFPFICVKITIHSIKNKLLYVVTVQLHLLASQYFYFVWVFPLFVSGALLKLNSDRLCLLKRFIWEFLLITFVERFVWIEPLLLSLVLFKLKTVFVVSVWLWPFTVEVHSGSIRRLWTRHVWNIGFSKISWNLGVSPHLLRCLNMRFFIKNLRSLTWTMPIAWIFIILFHTGSRKFLTARQIIML